MLAVCLLSALGFCQDKPWNEIRSAHFRLITNGSDRDARHVVRAFEQMRSVFANQFPGFSLEAPEPLLILAPRDEDTAKMLLPEMWKGAGGPRIAGLFSQQWESEYAVVRMDVLQADRKNPDDYSSVYHEYVHSLLHANFRWLPTWLDEGLAEFYAYTRFDKDHIYIGAPPKSDYKAQLLDRRAPVPLATFIATRSSFARGAEDTSLFYGEAWALTHFLTFGPGMQQGDRLKQFFNLLQRGVAQKKAFEQAFGNIDEVDKQYQKYIERFAFTTGVAPNPPGLDEKDFVVRNMSLAETQAELAGFEIGLHHWDLGRTWAEAALKTDPKLGLAHQRMGFVEFNDGKDEDALREFGAAVDLDPKLYLSLFARTMASPIGRSKTPADQALARVGLLKVLELNPQFAAAYVELAKLDMAQGDLASALRMSQKAEGLESLRAGYHLLSGQILLRQGHPQEASARAAYVADRWSGPDHDEAMELWESIPAEHRSAEAPALLQINVNSLQTADGVVKTVSCHGRAFSITMDRGGEELTFRSQGFPVGFADTLWVGRDHFTPCFHVEGLRAVVKYKVSLDKSYTGDMVTAGFRDNLFVAPRLPTAVVPQ